MKKIIMENDFFLIADTHFGHNNIIALCLRPFASVEEMDKAMIDNWNMVVGNEDTVLHLGDVAIANSQKIEGIVKKLNGKKKLARGNHDYSNSVTKWKRLGFDEVITTTKNPHEFVLIEYEGQEYALSHYYLPKEWGYKNIHGHIHNKIEDLDPKQQVCISVENIGYKPIKMSQVVKMFQ